MAIYLKHEQSAKSAVLRIIGRMASLSLRVERQATAKLTTLRDKIE